MYESRAVVRTFYKITSDEWSDGPLQLASRAVAGGSRKTYLSALKQFIKRSERSATVDSALNESMSVFTRRKRGILSAAILLASLRLLEKLELLPAVVKPMHWVQSTAIASVTAHNASDTCITWLGKKIDGSDFSMQQTHTYLAHTLKGWLKLACCSYTKKRWCRVIGKIIWASTPGRQALPFLQGPMAWSIWAPHVLLTPPRTSCALCARPLLAVWLSGERPGV